MGLKLGLGRKTKLGMTLTVPQSTMPKEFLILHIVLAMRPREVGIKARVRPHTTYKSVSSKASL